jgi:hypothetical protein
MTLFLDREAHYYMLHALAYRQLETCRSTTKLILIEALLFRIPTQQ